MEKTAKPLSEREERFCWHYTATQNAKEAAVRAGYGVLFAEKAAERLMRNEAVAQRITELYEQRKQRGKDVRAGLERLAFGSIADAVELLCAENAQEINPQQLDLFCVSELKRPKGGGFEMKFFDRLKALERLAELEEKTAEQSISPFYRAIEQGAAALFSRPGERDD